MNKLKIAMSVIKLAYKLYASRRASKRAVTAKDKANKLRKEYQIQNAIYIAMQEALVAGVAEVNN